MISFDIKSLFTSIPLDKATEIILQRIYNRNEITTQIPKKVMKELLFYVQKKYISLIARMAENILAYSNRIYQQNDGVAMGSPFRSGPCWYIYGRT